MSSANSATVRAYMAHTSRTEKLMHVLTYSHDSFRFQLRCAIRNAADVIWRIFYKAPGEIFHVLPCEILQE